MQNGTDCSEVSMSKEEQMKAQWKRSLIWTAVILVKLLLMGFFSSDYQDIMFIPFVETFLSGKNPYDYYYKEQLLSSFPYPPLMLLIEAVGGCLSLWVHPSSVFFRNLIFKLPLLIFDILGYRFIRKMGVGFKYALIFYFCSPVILYGIYVHGQLDVIPTVLLLASVYHATSWEDRYNLHWSAMLLGFALSTKFHILAAVPVLLMYVATKKGILTVLKYLLLASGIVFIFSACFMGPGLIENVFFNKEQSVLLTVGLDYGTTKVILPILVLLLIYLKIFELNYFNKNLLVSMLGLLFAVFLICVPPMPAWFTWIVPFIALYFGYVKTDRYKAMLIYAGFNLMYLIYFLFLHQNEFVDVYLLGKSFQHMKVGNFDAKSVSFTVMAAFLGMVIYKIYNFGIASNSLYRRGNVPFTIGIAGDSGAGKSRLLEKIENLFEAGKDILFIEGDGDHRWVRNDENWEQYTALDPKANYLYRQAEDIRALKWGNHVDRTDYDHDHGTFTPFYRVHPQKYIVLCGLHSLYLPQLRKELDLKIFMDTEDELRKFWKIERDTKRRGYSKEQIVLQIEKRRADAVKYIYPQKEYADMVITYFDKTLKDCYVEGHEVVLSLKLELELEIDLEGLIWNFQKWGIFPQHKAGRNFRKQELVFDGQELVDHTVDYELIAREVIPQYKDLFTYQPKWGEGVEGIIQLFLLIVISRKMRGQ